jgi:ABC-type Fe3+-hydroxamate transport system substrate-binding protein
MPVVEHLGDVSGERLRAFVPIWRRPWMTVNGSTYGASLLGSIGVDLVTADLATEYPTVDLDDIARLGPDVVLVPSEPYSFGDQHIAELRIAFADSRVVRVDGEDLFWWGIRTPGAAARLALTLG